MTGKPEDFLVQAWKQQLDAGLRFIETVIEGATKLREAQLEAAADAHADAEATRKALAAASDPSQLMTLQVQWVRANLEKAAAHWRRLYDIVAETDAALVKCACSVAPAAGAPAVAGADADASKQALLGLIDSAYKQWFDATQQFYKLPAIPAGPKAQPRTAA